MTRAERAEALHRSGSSCSQAVVSVFARDLGVDEVSVHKLATGLGGGVSRTGMICGAISGGVLALSLMYGNESGADQDSKLKTYEIVAKFIEAMRAKYGSAQCRDLLNGADLWTEAGRNQVKEEGLSDKVCNPIIVDVVDYIEKLLPAEVRHG